MAEPKKNEGAMWVKQDKFGQPYLSGHIEIDGKKVRFNAFKNNHKKEDRHPEWQMFISKPKTEPLPSGPIEEGEVPF